MKRCNFGRLTSGFFKNRFSNRKARSAGFSYIEVMIALVILMVGVLQMASALSANLLRSYETEKRIIAKQMALSTIESIISARDIARTDGIKSWESIGNVGSNPVDGAPRGIFLTGWCPVREEEGYDGVAGTADDACPEGASCTVTGFPSNTSAVVKGYQRQVVITDVDDPERPAPQNPIARRKIEVTIKYYYNSIARQDAVSTIVSNY